MSESVPVRSLQWLVNLGDPVAEVSWSPDGSRLAAGGVDGRLALLEAADGRLAHGATAHEHGLFHCAYSPTDMTVATAGQDGRVKLWDGSSGAAIKDLPFDTAWVEQLAWSPQGTWLAASAGRQLRLWNPATGVVHESTGHRSTIAALAWRRDGTQVASAGYGGVELWEVATGRHLGSLPWKTSLVSVAWSPDGRWVVAGTQELAVQIWELPFKPGEELAMSGYAAKVRELAWHHNGRFLATGGGPDLMVWNCGGRGPAGTSPKILQGHTARVTALDYQEAGHVLASGAQDGLVLLWNAGLSTQALRKFTLPAPVTALRWAADSRRFAAGCHDGSVGVGECAL